jgi:hypothetical protein
MAAQRRGIKIQWIKLPVPEEEALRRRLVDLYPLLAITPRRAREFHLTKPWILNSFCVFTTRPIDLDPDRLNGKTVAFPDFERARQVARTVLRGGRPLPQPSLRGVFRAVCAGQADAGFTESCYFDAFLLKRRPERAQADFRVRHIANAVSQGAIASTKEAAERADELRQGISDMARDGTLPALIDRWSSNSAGEMRSYLALQQADAKSRQVDIPLTQQPARGEALLRIQDLRRRVNFPAGHVVPGPRFVNPANLPDSKSITPALKVQAELAGLY